MSEYVKKQLLFLKGYEAAEENNELEVRRRRLQKLSTQIILGNAMIDCLIIITLVLAADSAKYDKEALLVIAFIMITLKQAFVLLFTRNIK